jgi:DNA polymerase/3'-5' exonuclease PolX
MMSKKPGLHRGSSRSGRSKRVAEQLFLRTYDLELEQAKDYRIWAYRKAAWTVDE